MRGRKKGRVVKARERKGRQGKTVEEAGCLRGREGEQWRKQGREGKKRGNSCGSRGVMGRKEETVVEAGAGGDGTGD